MKLIICQRIEDAQIVISFEGKLEIANCKICGYKVYKWMEAETVICLECAREEQTNERHS